MTPPTDGTKKPRSRRAEHNFKDRIAREGRLDEFYARLKELKALNDVAEVKVNMRVTWLRAAREFGYQGAKENKIAEGMAKSLEQVIVDRVAPSRAQKEFEESVAELPPAADPNMENEWVTAHPAISRKTRMKDSVERVHITRADLMQARHGKCPSARAANKLQYWANKPDEAFKNLAVMMKSASGSDADKEADIIRDPTLDEIEKMLEEVTGDA